MSSTVNSTGTAKYKYFGNLNLRNNVETMALVLRGVPSLAKRGSRIPQIIQLLFPIPFQAQHSFSTASSSDPLLSKLLQTPTSKIIITLDSDHSFNLKSSQLSWDPLITNLRSSSPEKAHLVITLTFSFHFFSCLLVKCKK
jgi:hypothetical protein